MDGIASTLKVYTDCENANTLSYEDLKYLCHESPEEIMTTLVENNTALQKMICSDSTPDHISLLLKILAKACKCKSKENKAALLSSIFQTQICHSIEKHVFRIQYDSSVLFEIDKGKNTLPIVISNLFKVIEELINCFPNTDMDKIRKCFINVNLMMRSLDIKLYVKGHLLQLYVEKDLLKLWIRLENIMEEQEINTIKRSSKLLQKSAHDDKFREKFVYPSLEDLLGDDPPSIHPNIVEGTYADVEQYLDIQFRLLREDFISPLRQALRKLKEGSLDSKKQKHIDNVNIYKKVLLGNSELVKDLKGIIVQFDPEKKLTAKREYSKMFMFGSLLIFIKDNFRDVILGTVICRDMEYLRKGEVVVSLYKQSRDMKKIGSEFLMVESEVYFKPYKHVLRALQGFHESSFPMKEYIIFAQKKSSPPKYLLRNPHYFYDVEHHQIQVTNETSWPDENSLGLHGSQLTAFKAALTEEFVIIQGPPGTGKTYLGLKIAKVLLNNSELWNADETPILVVCYTNHALDQFLEGLVPLTDKIVRVGGQSKSSRLGKYNIKEKRKKTSSGLKNFVIRMSDSMKTVKAMQANLEELEKRRGIVSVKTMEEHGVISTQHIYCFKHHDNTEGDLMQNWLWEGIEKHHGTEIDDQEEEEKIWLQEDSHNEKYNSDEIKHDIKYTLCLKTLEEEIAFLMSHLQRPDLSPTNKLVEMGIMVYVQKYLYENWKSYLSKKFPSSDLHIKQLRSVSNLWSLPSKDRWILYNHWVNILKNKFHSKIRYAETSFRDSAKTLEEQIQISELNIMKMSLVVGMTTTTAARLHNLLEILQPRIVIIEEAAEVLESHVIASLTSKCEHVILLGDHQQLRPKPSCYELKRDYNFDISLFERMVKNGMPCHTLKHQHRMRPEIAKLLVPAIYSDLKNDTSVHNYPSILGITRSLFFITHDVFEDKCYDGKSRRNKFEADFLLALCRYLVCQGYTQQEITVLATYKSQMLYLKNEQNKKPSTRNVHITSVDDYQGEENKIVLLSLVRSNEEARIGFLKTENRVCVALSRAREGLYIIGNMDNLVKSSEIWPRIKDALLQQDSYGTYLTLQCQIHPDQQTKVQCAEDFQKMPEGSCSLPCEVKMLCGHCCESICHVKDREHKTLYKCKKACERVPETCPFNHVCTKLCYKDCGKCKTKVERTLPCGHVTHLPCHINYEEHQCMEEVSIKIPNCGHDVTKLCHEDIGTRRCNVPCLSKLPCGHHCTLDCYVTKDPDHLKYKCEEPCTKINAECPVNHLCTKLCYEECGSCDFEVLKELPNCNHIIKVKCGEDIEQVECKEDCTKTLACGHKCTRKCFQKCGECQKEVLKVIPHCGHKQKVKCCKELKPSLCRWPCERYLDCGHRCRHECGEICDETCPELIPWPFEVLCGHTPQIPCYLQKSTDKMTLLTKYCQHPCEKKLPCGHSCKGTCSKCMQGRIHISCAEVCNRSLICGHRCKGACADTCSICSFESLYKCKHSKRTEICSIPHSCKKPCDWKCEHLSCTKLCTEICDRKPCYEPCAKKLKCGHDCIGFCGDTCPPLCRICDKEEIDKIFLENDSNTRFVYLVDCKHTIESETLDKWLQKTDKEIAFKTCPSCEAMIIHTERFLNHVKETLRSVKEINVKLHKGRSHLDNAARKLKSNHQAVGKYMRSNSKNYANFFDKCQYQLNLMQNNPKLNFSTNELLSMKSQVEIFNDLVESASLYYFEKRVQVREEVLRKLFSIFDLIVGNLREYHGKLSAQQIIDFNRECNRFLLASELAIVESSYKFSKFPKNKEIVKNLYDEAWSITQSIGFFSDLKRNALKNTVENLKKSIGLVTSKIRDRRDIVQTTGLRLVQIS